MDKPSTQTTSLGPSGGLHIQAILYTLNYVYAYILDILYSESYKAID